MSDFVPVTLYFAYGPGCHACEAAEPELSAFLRRWPSLMLIRINGNVRDEFLGVRIRVTPTYILSAGGEVVWTHEGGLKARELDAALKKQGVEP